MSRVPYFPSKNSPNLSKNSNASPYARGKYGNVFLNVKDSDFNKIRNNRSFKILVGGEYIENISLSYADVELCRPLLTISSSGYLQLALREGNFSRLLGVRTDDSIKITFGE